MISDVCQDLRRDIYDLYAEYEDEEVQDRFPVSPRLLLSPAKHLQLNLNVGGTVSPFTGGSSLTAGNELVSLNCWKSSIKLQMSISNL